MKKLINKLCSILIISAVMLSGINVLATENGLLYINKNQINKDDTVLYYNNQMLFPLRRIFEELGATVNWDDVEKHTIIEYDDEKYISKTAPANRYFPDIKAITVQNIKNLGKTEFSSFIQLNSMGVSGSFCIINDYTYLYQDTAERLFKAFGCKVEVDIENKTVYISTKN